MLRSDGDYDGAAQHLQKVLEQYPKDRVVRNDLGRVLFLSRKYPEAIAQLQQAIAVDPEDLQANYNLMLCYKGMGDAAKAAEYEKLYLRFKADESAQTITGPYRRLHPEDNNERQLIHEHVSAPLGAGEATVATGGRETCGEHGGQITRFHENVIRKIIFSSSLLCAALVSTGAAQVTFRDITKQAGINFVHNNGATGKKWLPETMGPGCAFIDYDNDGYPDILLVNGKDWTAPGKPSTLKLYHNNRNGTFTDVTAKAGLAISLFGMGAAVGDYDNDGFDDIYVSALGQSHLFHNNGNGTFTDVTKAAGMWGPNEFSTSAAWVDYDRDGKLDLIVVNYVQWSPQGDIYCTLDGTHKSYCTPESYKGASVRLWHNLGNGKFEDATAKAGLFDNSSKSLGVAVLDVNGDGWPDLVIANDTQPNKLYINNSKGGFTESAVSAGIAFSEDGVARAGMGVDAADYDHSGRPSIVIGNFANQMMALYHNEGNGLFVDEAPRSEVGRKQPADAGICDASSSTTTTTAGSTSSSPTDISRTRSSAFRSA